MTTVVDEGVDENGRPRLTITTPKYKNKFVVYKGNDGFSFFRVKLDKGKTPEILAGSYTCLSKARDAVVKYISMQKESATARRDSYYEENH